MIKRYTKTNAFKVLKGMHKELKQYGNDISKEQLKMELENTAKNQTDDADAIFSINMNKFPVLKKYFWLKTGESNLLKMGIKGKDRIKLDTCFGYTFFDQSDYIYLKIDESKASNEIIEQKYNLDYYDEWKDKYLLEREKLEDKLIEECNKFNKILEEQLRNWIEFYFNAWCYLDDYCEKYKLVN